MRGTVVCGSTSMLHCCWSKGGWRPFRKAKRRWDKQGRTLRFYRPGIIPPHGACFRGAPYKPKAHVAQPVQTHKAFQSSPATVPHPLRLQYAPRHPRCAAELRDPRELCLDRRQGPLEQATSKGPKSHGKIPQPSWRGIRTQPPGVGTCPRPRLRHPLQTAAPLRSTRSCASPPLTGLSESRGLRSVSGW